MNPILILIVIASYFGLLLLISYFTSKNTSDNSFYTGDRKSPWQLVAFGMVGAALSGVTFVSIPGMVSNNYFYYLQFVFGNVVGYIFITYVLIPIYYELKLVSIYTYLESRFGVKTYKTGSLFFLVSFTTPSRINSTFSPLSLASSSNRYKKSTVSSCSICSAAVVAGGKRGGLSGQCRGN